MFLSAGVDCVADSETGRGLSQVWACFPGPLPGHHRSLPGACGMFVTLQAHGRGGQRDPRSVRPEQAPPELSQACLTDFTCFSYGSTLGG